MIKVKFSQKQWGGFIAWTPKIRFQKYEIKSLDLKINWVILSVIYVRWRVYILIFCDLELDFNFNI